MYLSLGIPVIKQILSVINSSSFHLCLRLYVKLHVTLTLATWNTYAFNAEK